jgi:AGCS family alanine or glycine:cation symporter
VHRPWLSFVLKLAIMAAVTYGSVKSAGLAWDLGDVGVGLMAWLNIVAILIIQKPALLALKDYERQKKTRLKPRFDPESLGIRNAGFWVERLKDDKAGQRN